MLKKAWLLALIFLLACALEGTEFVIRYQTLSSGSIFYIETKERQRIGTVIREKKKGSFDYSFFSLDGDLLATGQTENYLANTSLRLSDSAGGVIGWFAAEIYNVYPSEYKLYNPENQLVAVGYMNWIGSAFTLIDPNSPKRFIATYFRPMFKLFFDDNWHFDIHEEGVVDFRLLSLIGVFQAACDLNFEMIDLSALNY